MRNNIKIIFIAIIAIGLLGLQSCNEDTDSSYQDFFYDVEGYTVNFTSVVSNPNGVQWDFGDGTSSTELNPVHTYELSGDYSITQTVDGHSYSKPITIRPSDFELLCGGTSKTWVLTGAYVDGINGAGSTAADLAVTYGLAENILYGFGLGEEYKNEYTFNADGTMAIDNNGGTALGGIIYGMMSGLPIAPSTDPESWPFCSITVPAPAEAKWSLETESLSVDCATFSFSSGGTTEETVTWERRSWLKFDGGGFLGYMDFQSEVVIKTLLPEQLVTAHFLTNSPDYGGKPGMMIHFTFEPK